VLKKLVSVVAIMGCFGALGASCGPSIQVVDDDGAGVVGNCNDSTPTHSTIQAGVNAAPSGGTVFVCPGTYPGNVVIDHSINLQGAQAGVDGRTRAVPVVQEALVTGTTGGAPGKFDVTTGGDKVTIDGFLFQAVTDSDGVHSAATTSGLNVKNNIFRNNVFGLFLDGTGTTLSSVSRNLFDDNNLSGSSSGNGIYSEHLSGAEIFNNHFATNQNAGILFAAGLPIKNVVIRNNTGENNASFVALQGGESNITIRNNSVDDTVPGDNGSQGSQVFVLDSSGVLVSTNTLNRSPFAGVALRGTSDNVDVLSNTVTNAADSGIDVSSTTAGAASEVRSNTTNSNAVDGIHFASGTSGSFVSANSASSNTNKDCEDNSSGTNRAGVANYWSTDNIGSTSTPTGLCHP